MLFRSNILSDAIVAMVHMLRRASVIPNGETSVIVATHPELAKSISAEVAARAHFDLRAQDVVRNLGLTFAADNFTRHLAAGAMLVVETNASDFVANIAGSAQVLSTGNVTGYEVFRWSKPKQETAVSFETRTPGSFVLPFDNTGTLST